MLGATDAYYRRTEFCTVLRVICNYSNTSLNAQNALKEKRVFSKSAFSRVIVVWTAVQIWYFVPMVIHA
jgi:ribose 1,5-bisphosphokinase PhnN